MIALHPATAAIRLIKNVIGSDDVALFLGLSGILVPPADKSAVQKGFASFLRRFPYFCSQTDFKLTQASRSRDDMEAVKLCQRAVSIE